MRFLRWVGELVVSFLCLVGPFISLRAILYAVLITAGAIVFFLVLGTPKDVEDKELAQTIRAGGDLDEAQVYALTIDRGMRQAGRVVKRWSAAFLVIVVVLGLLFVIRFLSGTEYSHRKRVFRNLPTTPLR